jgi:hypothetical protein
MGHSQAIVPRGPDLTGTGDRFSTRQEGDVSAGGVVVDNTAHGFNLAVYWVDQPHMGWPDAWRRFTVNSQLDVVAVAAVLNRYSNALWRWRSEINDAVYPLTIAMASVFACSAETAYNLTITAGVQYGFSRKSEPVSVLYHIPIQRRNSQRFVGVSLAPFDLALPAQVIPPPPPPTPTPTCFPTPLFSSVPAPAANYSDVGPMVGPLLLVGEDSLLVLRMGNASSAYATGLSAERARPLFIDVLSRRTGATLASLPLPTTRSGVHRACTGSLRSLSMKLRFSQYVTRFATLPCYDVEAYEGDIWLTASPTARPAGASSAAPPTSTSSSTAFVPVPTAVAAQVHALGNVDTRTVISNATNCGFAAFSSILVTPDSVGRVFYAGAEDIPGTPVEKAGACGVRYVPHGNTGTHDVLMTTDVGSYLGQSAFMLTLLQGVFAMEPGTESMTLYCFACGTGAKGAGEHGRGCSLS